ncbi:Ethanolamine kinase 2 [Erysiphe necator]|uniref:ethanolamine kinase n=1 Tax=Uncinula necator TaxID=52586 RepID=A0A0B1PEP0_UNCNE|nr:Ethanolamine kinase 2 [Erysiphe necator]KHJ35371.1 putative ethanolamine kinase [Erysiphe necator]
MTTQSLLSSSPSIKIPLIPLNYSSDESHQSALRIILALRPNWKNGQIEFIRFTDGTTNTLLKVINKLPELSDVEIDNEAILLRAYGPGTELIIDREQEAQNHELLMQYKLAPELLARFHNGMLYRFLRGSVTSTTDLRKQEVWLAVARRLAEWHAVVPCIQNIDGKSNNYSEQYSVYQPISNSIVTELPKIPHLTHLENIQPNLWTVLKKWVSAVPTNTIAEKSRQQILQKETDRLILELSNRLGLGKNSLVFAHCDLLSGNIVMLPRSTVDANATLTVSFIDFEYATPSPAAFDIANHFAEWGGFDCDYHQLPTQSQRIDFIREYIKSYYRHLNHKISDEDREAESKRLFSEVDLFRGVPGLYWGVWALIQSKISKIDFDYASYAEIRLSEYWDWRAEHDGTRAASGGKIPLREARWAED